MTILHVLSQFEVTGAEVYAVSLAHEQVEAGHRVLIVSDTLGVQSHCQYIEWPIGKRSLNQRIKNIRFLIRLIRGEKIQLVHAHSRAASWVTNFATKITGTAFVSTVHGRQHIHASSRSVNVYGKHIIAISESLRAHLAADLGIPLRCITAIPNGLDTRALMALDRNAIPVPFPRSAGMKILLIVTRMSGPKGDVLRFLLRDVMPSLSGDARFCCWIVGGSTLPPDILNLVTTVNDRAGRHVVEIELFRHDIPFLLKRTDAVLGSGRVALEGLAVGTSVFGFGENEYLGRITSDNFEYGCVTNFGDTGTYKRPDPERIIGDLERMIGQPPDDALCQHLQKEVACRYDIRTVASAVLEVYDRAFLDKQSPLSIPVLMYHRVVAEVPSKSRHGIWVTATEFRQQMQSLHRRGFTPITFYDIDEFRKGRTVLPAKPIVITFDDGYADNHAIAFPILKEFDFSAVIYMVMGSDPLTNHWDADEPQVPLMNHMMIREMSTYGIEFGSHTMTHPHLPVLSREQLDGEMIDSKRVLEAIIQKTVISFAYPYADYSDAVKRQTAAAGYRYAVVADKGSPIFHQDFFAIRRTQIFPGTPPSGFWRKTQSWYTRYRQWKVRNVGNVDLRG